ncbi:MAG: hypothetical protein ACR2IF_13755 [Terriglobales bacterium]
MQLIEAVTHRRAGPKPEEMNTLREVIEEVDQAFARYPVRWSYFCGRLELFGLIEGYEEFATDDLVFDEPRAVQSIARLVQLGLIGRVRPCEHCERWFFARFKHQVFCRPICQQRWHVESEGEKKQRAKYMRARRREEREAERRSWEKLRR